YKDRFTLPFVPEVGTTVRIVFLVSDGSEVAEFAGAIDGRYIEFRQPYSEVEQIPNGALFYIYMDWGGADPDGEDMLFYGTVFRRQHVFPDNPAVCSSTVVRLFDDNFQRPAGSVG